MNQSKYLEGRILKGIGGFYYIQDAGGCVHECKAPGRFRNESIVPLTGDDVLFSSGGFIEEIRPRRNELTRPRVVNIDIAAIVVSAAKPKIDYLLCDKLIVSIMSKGIEPLLIINKCDTGDKKNIECIQAEYANVCGTVCVSAKCGDGIEGLKNLLKDKCTCFAGQSAAGKSSIINALIPGLGLQTGGLSKKSDRGTHTTRQAELLVSEGFSGAVVDTPGFSFFNAAEIEPEELSLYYKDMSPHNENCRFNSCLHANEPDCAVKEAVNKGIISKGRYKRYLDILNEITDKRSRKYD